MPNVRFRYRAMSPDGSVRRGDLTAATTAEVERRLSAQNLALIDCRPRRLPSLPRGMGGGVALADLARTTSELAALLDIGIPVVEAVHHARINARADRLRATLDEIADALREGRTLTQALEPHERVFGAVAIGMLAASEPAGHLAPPLHDLAAHYRRLDQTRSRLAKATRYPLILLVLIGAVAATMFGMVVPELAAFLQSAGGRPGLPTRLLFHVARLGEHVWPAFVVGAVALPVGLRIGWSLPATRQRFQGLALALPAVGPILRRVALARFAHFLALSLKSGRDLLPAMADAATGAGNAAVARQLDKARLMVTEGTPPADALAIAGGWPPLAIAMIRTGETTGDLTSGFTHAGDYLERDADNRIDRLLSMVEPALTALMGLLLGWIAYAVVGALYDGLASVEG